MPPLQCRAKRNGMLRAEFTALNWIRFLPRALAAAFDSARVVADPSITTQYTTRADT
jgi:hypothetical protein